MEEHEEREANPQDAGLDSAGDAGAGAVPDGEGGSAVAKAKSRPQAYKSAEARARDERTAANFALYEQKTDEELKELVPKLSSGATTSIGAMLHAAGELCAV